MYTSGSLAGRVAKSDRGTGSWREIRNSKVLKTDIESVVTVVVSDYKLTQLLKIVPSSSILFPGTSQLSSEPPLKEVQSLVEQVGMIVETIMNGTKMDTRMAMVHAMIGSGDKRRFLVRTGFERVGERMNERRRVINCSVMTPHSLVTSTSMQWNRLYHMPLSRPRRELT